MEGFQLSTFDKEIYDTFDFEDSVGTMAYLTIDSAAYGTNTKEEFLARARYGFEVLKSKIQSKHIAKKQLENVCEELRKHYLSL